MHRRRRRHPAHLTRGQVYMIRMRSQPDRTDAATRLPVRTGASQRAACMASHRRSSPPPQRRYPRRWSRAPPGQPHRHTERRGDPARPSFSRPRWVTHRSRPAVARHRSGEDRRRGVSDRSLRVHGFPPRFGVTRRQIRAQRVRDDRQRRGRARVRAAVQVRAHRIAAGQRLPRRVVGDRDVTGNRPFRLPRATPPH